MHTSSIIGFTIRCVDPTTGLADIALGVERFR